MDVVFWLQMIKLPTHWLTTPAAVGMWAGYNVYVHFLSESTLWERPTHLEHLFWSGKILNKHFC